MAELHPRYSKEEFARRGDAIYERDIKPAVEPARNGEFAVIDIETGAYEIDADELAASDRLFARLPDAQPCLRRVGSRYARRMRGVESMTEAQPQDLERRLVAYRANPKAGSSWEEVKARLQARP